MMSKEKIVRNICMGLYFFLSGVEYAVILPTLNGYLKSLGAEQYFLGIVLSAFSFTGLLSAPIYGRITDKTRSTKLCVIIGNVFEIGGNLLYFVSGNQYMVLGGRLIAGIGSGAASSIFGMISRTTTEEERTKAFSLLMSLRQIGLIVGPAFNLFMHDLDFYLGSIHVNEYNSPGLLMAIIWILHTLLLLIIYKDVEKGPPQIYSECNETTKDGAALKSRTRSRATSVFEDLRNPSFIKEFLRDEVIVCLAINFMVQFAQTGLEAALTPVSLLFFGWGSLENSYLFCGGSAVAVASFVSLTILSKRFSDRAMMLFGCVGMVATYALFLTFAVILSVNAYPATPSWVLPLFIVDVTMSTVFLPYLWLPQAALFSKLTNPRTQGFNQGVRMALMRFGQILGPIWASSLATLEGLPVMLGVDLFLTLMIAAMIVLSYKRLYPRLPVESTHNNIANSTNDHVPNVSPQEEHDETAPLLANSGGQKGLVN